MKAANSSTKSARLVTKSLFVYGSLLDPAHQRRLLGHPVQATHGRLRGFERRRGRYYYLVPRQNAEICGLVIGNLSRRDFDILDRYEGVPELYRRELVKVITKSGQIRCWCYLLTGAKV